MKKLKITESKRSLLEVKAAAKLKESISRSNSPSATVTNTFNSVVAHKIKGMKVEGVEMPIEEIQMSELAPKVLEFIKLLYLNPSKDKLDPFWESVGISWDELIQLLTELTLIKSAASGYRLQRLDRVGGPTAVIRIVTKLVHKLINDKRAPVEEVKGREHLDDIAANIEKTKRPKGKDVNADSFKKQIGEPKKTGKTRGELLAVIAQKKAEEQKRREAENNKPIGELEEDNLPLGAANDSSAPFNQVDPPEGRRPEQETLNMELYMDDLAIFSKDGKLFLYNVESADADEYEPYASRGETPMGRDEHGDMEVEYGDLEMDGDIVNAYVNDNIGDLSLGMGKDDAENGVELVEVDQALAQDLLGLREYMKDPKRIERLTQLLGSIGETTGAASSGAFVGTLGAGGSKPIHKSNVASEMRGVIDEDMDGSLKSEILTGIEPFVNIELDPETLMSFWFNNETKLKEVIDKIQTLGDDEWKLMFEFIIKGLQSAEMHIQQKDVTGMGNFKHNVDGLISFVNHFSSNIGEATTVGSVGGDSGTFAYDAPVGDGGNFWTAGNKMAKKMPLVKKGGVNEMIAREGKDAKTDTQWPGGSFVEFDDCTKYNNNKVAQNGGCSTGAVDGVVKTKSSKHSVISDASIYETIANETGRTIEEVKTILDSKNNETK